MGQTSSYWDAGSFRSLGVRESKGKQAGSALDMGQTSNYWDAGSFRSLGVRPLGDVTFPKASHLLVPSVACEELYFWPKGFAPSSRRVNRAMDGVKIARPLKLK